MAEVFFGAAWAAGVVEGGSVLFQASKQDDKTRGDALLLVPSILYGTAALPLGIIGASPGPSLVSSFLFAPSMQALENNGVNEAPTVSNNKNTNDKSDDAKPTPTTNKQESETPSDQQPEEQAILSRSDFIRKVREDNRRSLAAKQQHRPSFRSSPKLIKVKRAQNPKGASSIKLLSTLDGRPLATPLAEAMRRARFLCVGAGLVLTFLSYQTSQQQQVEREKALQREQRLRGRDVSAIQSLIKNTDNDNGVVVRLVGQNDSFPGLMTNEKSSGFVLPLVHSVDSSAVNVPDNLPSITSNGHAYWNLGTTPQEWKETPLTKDWLLRSSDNDNACLILESDVSPNSLSDYLQDATRHVRLEPASIQLIENAMMVSRILSMIAKEKRVLPADDDETAVNVLIGAGPRPTWLDNTNTVYIDGSKTVGLEVSSILERLHSDAETPSTQQESDASKDMAASESESASTPSNDASEDSTVDAFSVFEYVGMKLREGGTHAATAVSRVFSRRDIKTVHVLSDSPIAAQWLQSTMPYGWTILEYTALEDIGLYHDVVAESGDGVTFVCCENDEATSALVCSLLSTNDKADASGQRLVVLVQEEACATELRNLGTQLNSETIVEIVSIKEVHNNLFGHARELLASGKSASEAQDSLDLID